MSGQTPFDRAFKTFAAWGLLASFLREHPPTAKMSPGHQKAKIRVLLQSEAWMSALFLGRRAGKKPMGLCELARALVGCDVDRHKAARASLRNRILPAFEAYELVQVTRENGRFAIVATDKLLAFLSDHYFPALRSNKDEWLEWLEDAAKEGDPSNEGDPFDEV